MARSRKTAHDVDGNDLPELPQDSDVRSLLHLLEYCRVRGFAVGPHIQIGSVIVEVRDLRQAEAGRRGAPELGVWEEHGHKEDE